MIKGPERKDLIDAITLLKRTKKKLFLRMAKLLEMPKRKRISVNVDEVSKYSKPNSVVVVPGKVLGGGMIDHKIEVVALSFSGDAKKKIESAGGKCRDFSWLIKKGTKDIVLLR